VAPENKYAYDPYGETQGPGNPAGSAAGRNPFRFQGFYHDAETRTYDMQARQYRPDIGRFLTQDRYESSSGDFNLQSRSADPEPVCVRWWEPGESGGVEWSPGTG
jgi:RHS repeat-associated protein